MAQISITKMKMTPERDNTLDCTCGILIIHMILGYIFQWSQLTATHFYRWMNILYFFMPWFFFKAGIFYKKTPVKRVLSTGFRRLIVPFIALSLIGHAFLCISFVQEGVHTWQDFLISPIKDILLLEATTGNFPLWFLLSLFFTKILYSLLNTQIPPTYITGTSCLSCFSHILVPYSISKLLAQYSLRPILLFDRIPTQRVAIQKNLVLSALIYISTLILTPSFVDMRSNTLLSGYYPIWLIGAIAGCITLNNICRSAKKYLLPILCTIGYHSILFYISHWIFLIITKDFIAYYLGFQNHPWIEFTAFICGTIIGCGFIYRFNKIIRFVSGS